jgi:hypothetical protein
MKKLLFLIISFVLLSCDANNSNVAKNKGESVKNIAIKTKADTMTSEEAAVAAKFGAIRAYKMADDTFKIVKMVKPVEIKELTESEYDIGKDSIKRVGVVSASGRYYVPIQYDNVHQIGQDVFVGHINITNDELYQIVYKGRAIGNFSYISEIKPICYRRKVIGFLKIFYNKELNENFLYYIDIRGKGWDAWLDVQVGSYPHFEYYKIENNILTIWGGGETPEDLQAFPKEDRSLYQVDLSSGKVLANPFVPAG